MASKNYRAIETPVVFCDSGGDVAIALNDLAFGAGRVSARRDRGAGSLPRLHEIKAITQAKSGGFALKEVIEIWLFQSDGTYADGTVGTADAALTSDKRSNGMFIGCIVADTTSAATDIVATFQDVPISSRYYSIGWWNASAARNLNNSANVSRTIVTAMPDESQ